jgi:hypothetical protein
MGLEENVAVSEMFYQHTALGRYVSAISLENLVLSHGLLVRVLEVRCR